MTCWTATDRQTLSLIRECGESLLDDDDATDKLTVKTAGCKKV